MKEIRGDAKNIRALLSGAKFSVDYYQREYRWETKQISELVEDLAEKFLESYQEGDERSAVEHYGHYFLGSIIISEKDGRKAYYRVAEPHLANIMACVEGRFGFGSGKG